MKNKTLLMSFVALSTIIGLSFVSYEILFNTSNKTQVIQVKKENVLRKVIPIQGMTCVGCEVTLEKQIKKIDGVISVKASASDDNAVVAYDKTKTDTAKIRHTIKELGYTPSN